MIPHKKTAQGTRDEGQGKMSIRFPQYEETMFSSFSLPYNTEHCTLTHRGFVCHSPISLTEHVALLCFAYVFSNPVTRINVCKKCFSKTTDMLYIYLCSGAIFNLSKRKLVPDAVIRPTSRNDGTSGVCSCLPHLRQKQAIALPHVNQERTN